MRERGVAVPVDLSILTFDEAEWSEYLDPPITAMVQPAYDTGRRAFEYLKDRIQSGLAGEADRVMRLPAKLHVRRLDVEA